MLDLKDYKIERVENGKYALIHIIDRDGKKIPEIVDFIMMGNLQVNNTPIFNDLKKQERWNKWRQKSIFKPKPRTEQGLTCWTAQNARITRSNKYKVMDHAMIHHFAKIRNIKSDDKGKVSFGS